MGAFHFVPWLVFAVLLSALPVSGNSEYLLPPPAPINNNSVLLPLDPDPTSERPERQPEEEELEVEMIITIHNILDQMDRQDREENARDKARSRPPRHLMSTLLRRAREVEDACDVAEVADVEDQWFLSDHWTRLYDGTRPLQNLPYGQLGKPVLCLGQPGSDAQPLHLTPVVQEASTKQGSSSDSIMAWLCASDHSFPRICKTSLSQLQVHRCSDGGWVYRLPAPRVLPRGIHVCRGNRAMRMRRH